HFLFTFFSFSLSFLFFSNYTSITEIYTLSLHDALPIFPHDEIHPYIQTAAKDNAQFTLKTDPEYKTDPGSLAVVVAAKTAVYQSPVDVKKRYPNLVNSNSSMTEKNNDQHQSFFHHLFHRKDRG